LDDLTEEHAEELEQAARRQLDRTKAAVEKQRTLVDAGIAPAQSLAALTEEQMIEPPQALSAPATAPPVMERFDGDGTFTATDFRRVQSAFEQQFHKPLPVSAEGETAVHRALGFDHRDRVDVALFPDTTEGKWLRR